MPIATPPPLLPNAAWFLIIRFALLPICTLVQRTYSLDDELDDDAELVLIGAGRRLSTSFSPNQYLPSIMSLRLPVTVLSSSPIPALRRAYHGPQRSLRAHLEQRAASSRQPIALARTATFSNGGRKSDDARQSWTRYAAVGVGAVGLSALWASSSKNGRSQVWCQRTCHSCLVSLLIRSGSDFCSSLCLSLSVSLCVLRPSCCRRCVSLASPATTPPPPPPAPESPARSTINPQELGFGAVW